MNALRISLCLLALAALAACGGSSSPTAPNSTTTTQNQATVQVTRATFRAMATALAGLGSNIENNQDIDDGEFLDQTAFDAVATAEATVGLNPNGASAEGLIKNRGTATWPNPGELATLLFQVDGRGEAAVDGPPTNSYAAAGGGDGTVFIEFTVPAGGVDLDVRVNSAMSVELRDVDENERVDVWRDFDTRSIFVEAGNYRLVAVVGGGVTVNEGPPSGGSETFGGEMRLTVRTPQP